MNRLTEKYDINYKHKDMSVKELDDMYECLTDKNTLAQVFWKLGKLEDIEEELGISLITLFTALKNGIYVKEIEEKQKVDLHYNDLNEQYFFDNSLIAHTQWLLLPKYYGKTWALTKEELENEN